MKNNTMSAPAVEGSAGCATTAITTGQEPPGLHPADHDSPGRPAPACDRAHRPGQGVSSRGAALWLWALALLGRARNKLMLTCSGQAGTSTAEYAIATLAAVAFAGLLVVIMRSDEVRGFLLNIIRTALAIP